MSTIRELVASDPEDFSPISEQVSLYRIDDDGGNLDRVVAALASLRNHVSNLDYLLLDETDLLSSGIDLAQTAGLTLDAEVNKIHFDWKIQSARKVVDFAAKVMASLANHLTRRDKRFVTEKIISAHNNGWIKLDQCKPELQANIKENAQKFRLATSP